MTDTKNKKPNLIRFTKQTISTLRCYQIGFKSPHCTDLPENRLSMLLQSFLTLFSGCPMSGFLCHPIGLKVRRKFHFPIFPIPPNSTSPERCWRQTQPPTTTTHRLIPVERTGFDDLNNCHVQCHCHRKACSETSLSS